MLIFVSVRRNDADGGFICGIANNVIAVRVNVDLITRVRTETARSIRVTCLRPELVAVGYHTFQAAPSESGLGARV